MKRVFLLPLLVFTYAQILAQVVRTNPPFPNPGEKLTINFNASQGNKGLENCNCDVYIYTGVTIAGQNWQNIQGVWGQANPNLKMSRTGLNTFTFIIEDLRAFYGLANDTEIEKISVLFHNEGGSQAGRGDGGSDIFFDVFPEDAAIISVLQTPAEGASLFVSEGETISIEGLSNTKASLRIDVDGAEIARSEVDTFVFSYDYLVPNDPGNHIVDFIAVNTESGASDTTSFSFFQVPEPEIAAVPDDLELGLNRTGEFSVALVLEAPNKKAAFVRGNFNQWATDLDYLMKKSPDGQFFWLEIDNLNDIDWNYYEYQVDGIVIADPFSELIVDRFDDPSIPISHNDFLPPFPNGTNSERVSAFKIIGTPYDWQVTDFEPAPVEELNIYELLMRDLFETSSYEVLIDTLDYLQRLGINAIELMPVSEFENNDSWGYNPSFHMALDKYYGHPLAFKIFVDEAHKRGMAVILDVVYNHAFGESPFLRLYLDDQAFRPSQDNPWLNQEARHPFNVGFDFNHESESTKRFVQRVNQYWMDEYKVDGYRFDLSKGFTQSNNPNDVGAWSAYDGSRIAIWKNIGDEIWGEFPNAILILEHFADNTEEKELADYGFLLWGNLNHNYGEAVIGNINESNFQWGYYKNRGWNNPHVVTFMESHDEERIMYKAQEYGRSNGSYDVKRLGTALNRTAMAHTFFWTIPGPKMIWQFGELGYDFSINDCGNGTISNDCRLSRKPIRWDYLNVEGRLNLYNHIADLTYLRAKYPTTFQDEQINLNLQNQVKTITLNSDELSVVAVGNFGVTQQNSTVNFPSDGTWYDYLSEQTLEVSGGNSSFQLLPGQQYLWMTQDIERPSLSGGVTSSNDIKLIEEVNIYPNPVYSGESLRLQIGDRDLQDAQFRILDSRGVVVSQFALPDNFNGLPILEVEVPQLPGGLYFIDIYSNTAARGLKAKVLIQN